MTTPTFLQCRICLETTKQNEIIQPCDCKGTMANIHTTCLTKQCVRLVNEGRPFDECGVCKGKFNGVNHHEFTISRMSKSRTIGIPYIHPIHGDYVITLVSVPKGDIPIDTGSFAERNPIAEKIFFGAMLTIIVVAFVVMIIQLIMVWCGTGR